MGQFKAGNQGLIARRLVAIALVLLFLAGCTAGPRYKKVQLKGSEEEIVVNSLRSGRPALRVAIAGVISPKETLRTYNRLLEYLGEKLDRPVQLIQKPTYAEINDLLRSGNADLAFVCGLAYVEGNREFGMELLVAPEVRGEPLYRSYLIVPLDSSARQLADLRGKTFAFTDPLSNSGRLVPTYQLAQTGETPESFFKNYVFTYSHDNSIKAVAEKLVDAAAVDSLVYDYSVARSPLYASKTRIIWSSPAYGSPPVVVPAALSAELKSQLRELFLDMDGEESGKGILQDLMIDRFVLADERAYDPIRQMAAKVRQ